MIKKYLFKTKIVFAFIILSLMGSVIYTTQHRVLEKQVATVERESRYLGYRIELSSGSKLSLASLGALFWGILGRPGEVAHSNASALNNSGTAESVPVLVYHGITSKPDQFSLTEERFKEHMFALKDAGYQTISLSDFIAFINGEKTLPKKSFLLTFDDGRIDSYQGADPLLKALNYSAVMYVATAKSLIFSVGNDYYIDKTHIDEMVKSGRWEFGSHAVQRDGGFIPVDGSGTLDHFLSSRMWLEEEGRLEDAQEYEARVRDELTESKNMLQDAINRSVSSFSYPFGDYGRMGTNFADSRFVIKSAVKANYDIAFRQSWPLDDTYSSNYASIDDHHYLRRIEPNTGLSGRDLIAMIEKGHAKKLPYYTDTFSSDNGWKITWGDYVYSQNYMQLSSTPTGSGAFSFLDGTRYWRDYMYKVILNWNKGGYVTLFARYIDNDNYVACTFGENMVKIEEKVNGNLVTLIADDNPISVPKEKVVLGMSVNGPQIRCYEGAAVATLVLNHTNQKYGGIGIRIWDENIDNASIDISTLEAVEISEARELISSMPLYGRH